MTSGVRWLADSPWYFSVTFGRGISARELGTLLGADPAVDPVPAEDRDIGALLTDANAAVARLGEADRWAFAVEYGDARGTRRSKLTELSRACGTAVNLDPQEGNPPPMFSCAQDGELACAYGLGEEHRRWGGSPDLLRPALEEAGVLLPDGTPLAVAAPRRARRTAMSLGVIERYFGLSLPHRPVLAGQLPTVVLADRVALPEPR